MIAVTAAEEGWKIMREHVSLRAGIPGMKLLLLQP